MQSRILGLDGLRAVAVVGVIAHHLSLPGSAIGWTGVELFFVLSGFLITGILVADKDSEHFYRTFYSRRSLRIFPIYYLTFTVLVVSELALGRSVSAWPSFATYTQNWLYAVSPTFANDGAINFSWGASHTWSLAIEEQFYLLWPLVVCSLSKRHLIYAAMLLIVLGPLSRFTAIELTGRWWVAYTPLMAQVDMLAWGALAAILYTEKTWQTIMLRLAICAVVLGSVVLILVWSYYGADTMQPGALFHSLKGQAFYTMFGPYYLSILILAMSGNVLTVALELPAFRYIGRISYGIYLYHWPIMLVAKSYLSYGAMLVTTLVATFAAASASYHWIERPILSAKDKLFPRGSQTRTEPLAHKHYRQN